MIMRGPGRGVAGWGRVLTCYTSALAVYLAAEDDRWWRRLADKCPHLGLSQASDGLLRFEHHPRSPVRLLGLRACGSDDWDVARAGILRELDAFGRVIIAADAWNVPWATSHGKRHGPHWFVLGRGDDGFSVEDPLELVGDLGRQSPVRVRLGEDGLRQSSGALVDPSPVHVLREEAMFDSSATALRSAYRWLVRDEPWADELKPVAQHGAIELACHFERGAADPATYAQVDDIWQALRQRELLVRALSIEEELGELRGLPERDPWERVAELWRRLPPLLMHAQLLARSGTRGRSATMLVETLSAIAEEESQLAADRFPEVSL